MAKKYTNDFLWTTEDVLGFCPHLQLDSNHEDVQRFCVFIAKVRDRYKDQPSQDLLFNSVLRSFLRSGNEHGAMLYVVKTILSNDHNDLLDEFNFEELHAKLFTAMRPCLEERTSIGDFDFKLNYISEDVKEEFKMIITKVGWNAAESVTSLSECCKVHSMVAKLFEDHSALLADFEIMFTDKYKSAIIRDNPTLFEPDGIKINLRGGEKCSLGKLDSKIGKTGHYGLSLTKLSNDIAEATQDWRGLKVKVYVTLQNKQANITVIPTTSSMIIKALNNPPRSQQKGHVMHEGTISLKEVINIARAKRHSSKAAHLSGTVKEVLGTIQSLGPSVLVDGMTPKVIIDQINDKDIMI